MVEDNPQVRKLTVERLRRLGYLVRDADNGPAALAALDGGQTANLVFTDVVMPGLSGFELARAVLQRTPRQRILLTSGFAEDTARGNDGLLAEQAILRKPYSLAELASAVRRALDKPEPG